MATTERRRWRPPVPASAQGRMLLAFVVLLAAAALVSTVALRQILLARLDERVDRQLTQEVQEFRRLAAVGRNPATGLPFGDDAAAIFDVFLERNVPGDGETIFTFVGTDPYRSTDASAFSDDDLRRLARLGTVTSPERGEVRASGEGLRYLAVPVELDGASRGVFAVAADASLEEAEIEDAVRTAAVIWLVVLLLATFVAYLLARRVLAPLREVTRTARRISETDLSHRIPVGGDDEVAELARTFNGMLDRLERAFDGQRAFLSDAGHELRTPIAIVRGHLEVMGDDPVERREVLELVTDELDRMSRLVDDLLVLARFESGQGLHRETLDLDLLTEELLAKAAALAPRDWRLEAVGAGPVQADRQRLTQAVLNLAQNAVQHTSDGDAIRVGSSLHGGTARLWVADDGPGIPRADQERIFERFVRGSDRRGQDDGAGLGLAIVRVIAEAHGGTVELVSRPGAGARFVVAFPAEPAPVRPRRVEAPT